MKHCVLSSSDLEVNLLKNQPYMGYQVRIIQHGGSNLIITEHAKPDCAWDQEHRESKRKEKASDSDGGKTKTET